MSAKKINFRAVPVEQKLSKEELKHLHDCIRYTQQFKSVEAVERAKEESEIIMDEFQLEQIRKKFNK